MSDFGLHAMQSSQAPREVDLQQKLDTRGFDSSAFARLQGNHLVIPPGVPRIVAPENWATGEGEDECLHI
jgi:hypothetical protein